MAISTNTTLSDILTAMRFGEYDVAADFLAYALERDALPFEAARQLARLIDAHWKVA